MPKAAPNPMEIAPGLHIEGDLIVGNNLRITGIFKGTLRVGGDLVLAAGSDVAAPITCGSLTIEKGAVLNTVLSVGDEPPPTAPAGTGSRSSIRP